MYRTGDLARWRTDGDLEFVGREDDKVTVGGFRIEPGEIDTVLMAHPDVAQTTIINTRGSTRRQATSRLRRNHPQQPNWESPSLDDYLRQRLPNYMIPAALVMLDALPEPIDGTLDHDALPAPNPEKPTAAERREHRKNSCCASCSPQCWTSPQSASMTTSSTEAAIHCWRPG